MKLIVGLGNPEPEYTGTRHNVGFAALNNHILSDFKLDTKFKSLIFKSGNAIYIKPQTYYNLSGEAVQLVAHFYKIPPENILIIHDDLSYNIGTLRTRLSGRDAGNNGIKSVNSHISPNTARIRVGINQTDRKIKDDANFVLGKFSSDEIKILSDIYKQTSIIIDQFIAGDFQTTTHKLQ